MNENESITPFQFQPTWLPGKTALVTGGGRGIGREICLALGRAGCKVVLADIDAGATSVVDEITAAGAQSLFVQVDVADESAVNELKVSASAVFGAVDLLINNAIYCPVASVLSMDVATWDRVMAVNLRGAFLTCRAFIPAMLAQDSGVILNLVSTDAMPQLSAYIASKQGIAAFSQSLAGEVGGHGIHVVAFAPGFVDTPGLREAAAGLAPLMGMDVAQFMGLSLHPAYPGAMPAADAALAAVYLADRLAQDYHGEIVNGYTVLERAGFFKARAAVPVDAPPADEPADTIKLTALPGEPDLPDMVEPAVPDAVESPPAAEPAETSELATAPREPADTVRINALQPEPEPEPAPEPAPIPQMDEPTLRTSHEYVDLLRQLAVILDETEAELARLPLFVRPLAKQGFRVKTGLSLGEWQRLAASLLEHPDLPPPSELTQLLERLADYYRESPAETERFSKDAILLANVKQTADRRVHLIADLAATLQ